MARKSPTIEQLNQWRKDREQEEQMLLSLPDEEFEIEKCGYSSYFFILKSTQRRCIEYGFQNARYFHEGLAAVKLDGKWGFVDKIGSMVISCKYDYAGSFQDGLAVINTGGTRKLEDCVREGYECIGDSNYSWQIKGGKWGFIDKLGNEISLCKYSIVGNFKGGLAIVRSGKLWGVVDGCGNEVVPCIYNKPILNIGKGIVKVELDGKTDIINITSSIALSCKYDDMGSFSEGLAAIKVGSKWGFVNEMGAIVISCKYDAVGFFREGLTYAKQNGKYGYINKSGIEIIPFIYEDASGFHKDLAEVRIGEKRYKINKSGAINSEVKYNFLEAQELSPKRVQVYLPNTKCDSIGLKQSNDNPKNKYDIIDEFHDGLARAKRNGKWGFITKEYFEKIPCKYEDVFNFYGDYARVKINGKWGFINKAGRQIIHCIFDWVNDFHEGLAAVEYKEKWGYINTNGCWKIERLYSFAGDFNRGRARVKRRRIFGWEEVFYIDRDGYKK